MSRKCSKCGKRNPRSSHRWCAPCARPKGEALERKKAKNREYMKRYAKEGPLGAEERASRSKKRAEARRVRRNKEFRRRYAADPEFRLNHLMRHSLYRGVKGYKKVTSKDFSYAPCFLCGSEENPTIDHIVPVSRGGTHDKRNLLSLCMTCNQFKGARVLLDDGKTLMGSHH
jgi:5-methylcytosine-specific restriction endonuclease McrA